MKRIALTLALAATLSGCIQETDSKVAARNLATAADMFEINRRIVFYNGITDQYMLTIEGLCSVDTSASGHVLHVTCKTGARDYKKHMLGLSDNVSFVVEQLEAAKVSTYHYRVIFKPQTLVSDVDFRGSTGALIDAVTPDSED